MSNIVGRLLNTIANCYRFHAPLALSISRFVSPSHYCWIFHILLFIISLSLQSIFDWRARLFICTVYVRYTFFPVKDKLYYNFTVALHHNFYGLLYFTTVVGEHVCACAVIRTPQSKFIMYHVHITLVYRLIILT